MQQHGYRVIPVNPRYAEVLGEKCYPDLAEIPEPVDMVDVFRRTEDVLPIAQQALLYLNVPPQRDRPERWPGEPGPPSEEEPESPENPRRQPGPETGIVTAGLEAGEPVPERLPAGSLPDLAGMTARQALAATADLHLYPILRGAGVVQRQEPPPGSPMPPPGARVELYLASGAGG